MEVVGAGRGHRKAVIVSLDEGWQKRIAGLHVTDIGKPQFLDQPILQCPVHTLDASLGLAGIGAKNLDVQLR
ncbi:hypothetical protein D3C71_1167780 [compost metagenome]